jgi:rubrerythrin
MSNNLNLSEIIKSGIQIEKNGRDFYDHASKAVKAERVKQVFEFISGEEQSHLAVFEAILNNIGESAKPAVRYTQEYDAYLQALTDENPFTKPKQGYEIARTIRNDKHALELALVVEKDTLLFYHELKNLLPADSQTDIDTLITNEQDHFNKLSEVYKGFSKFGVNRG